MCYCTRKSQRGNFVYHTGRIVRRVEEATDNTLVIQERDYSDNPIKSPTEGDSDSGFTISIHGSKKSFNSHDDDLWMNGCSTSALSERGNSMKRRMVTVIFGEESNDNFFPPSSEDMRLDDACRIMESLVVSRPIDFIRKVFGLSIEDCERIEFTGHENTTGGKLSSLVRPGFQRWKQLNGLCATVENLIKALRCAERNDIADKIEDTLETSSIYKSSYKQAELDIAIGICKEVLELKNALPLFRQQMGLTEADISQVHGSDCVGVGLCTWKTKLGKYATVHHLLDCLEKAGLMSLHDDICRKLKITSPSSDEVQSTTSDCEATEERCILLEETEPKSHNHDAGMSSGIPIIGHYVIDRP